MLCQQKRIYLIHFTFSGDSESVRLDQYLCRELLTETRSAVQRLIESGNILVNDKQVRSSMKLRCGDRVSIDMPEPTPVEPLPESIPLEVVYEDAELIVINKPAGMVVHPGAGNSSGTLVNALLAHCADLSGIGGELRPGIVHRLDKGTSGVMVAAKNDRAHQLLSAQFSAHSIKRIYQALVYGNPREDSGKVEGIIGRHPTERLRLSGKARHGKHAVTRWRVRARHGGITLLELRLETGRTHQIRVHMTESGFPLVGDPLYPDGGRFNNITDPKLRKLITALGRQALHARVLGFIHPVSKRYLEFSAELPADMARLLEYFDGLAL